MLDRKAQGMSFKVIIVGVLALIVLVVLVMIFTGKARTFVNGTSETEGQYMGNACEIPGTLSQCRTSESSCESAGGYVMAGKECTVGVCCSQ